VALLIGIPVAAAAFSMTVGASTAQTPVTRAQSWLPVPGVRAAVTWEGTPIVQDPIGGHSEPVDVDGDLSSTTSDDPAPTIEAATQEIRDLLPGTVVSTAVRTSVLAQTPDGSRTQLDVLHLDTADPALRATIMPVAQGRLPEVRGEIVLSVTDAAVLHVGISDRVALAADRDSSLLDGNEAIVVGIRPDVPEHGVLSPGTAVAGPLTGLTTEEDASVAWWITAGAVPWSDVVALNAAGFAATSLDVAKHMPADVDVPYYQDGGARDDARGLDGWLVLAGAAGVGLLEMALLLAPAFVVGARRAERDLALVAASGGTPGALRRVVLLGAGSVGLVASSVGAAAGAAAGIGALRVVGSGLTGTAPAGAVVPVVLLLGLVVVAVLVCLAAALVPAVRAGRADTVAALTGRRAPLRIRRGHRVMAVAVLAAGLLAVAAGWRSSSMPVVVLGALVTFVGVIVNLLRVIEALGHLAPWCGPAGRFALRDAKRQSARSVGATAAVVGAIAAIVATSASAMATEAGVRSSFNMFAGQDMIGAVISYPTVGLDAEAQVAKDRDTYRVMATAAARAVPGTTAVAVQVALDPTEMVPDHDAEASWELLVDPHRCAAGDQSGDGTDPSDCLIYGGGSFRLQWGSSIVGSFGGSVIVVDDGTLVGSSRLDGASEATAALRQGKLLVPSQNTVWADGQARFARTTCADEDGDDCVTADPVVLPAAVTPIRSALYGLVMPPDLASDLNLRVVPGGLLVQPPAGATEADLAAITAALRGYDGLATVEVSRLPHASDLPARAAMIAALVAGLGATFLVLFLAARETDRDMRVFAAVGASPRSRRRIAAAQAVVVTGTGAVLGSVLGTGLAWINVKVSLTQLYDPSQAPVAQVPLTTIAVICVGVPLVAALGGYLFTRSRLPAPSAVR